MANNFRRVNFSLREILDLLIEFAYLAVIFLVPLYFALPWFPTYNIFELNKLVLFEILVWLLLFFTLLKIIFYWPLAPFAALSRGETLKALKKYWLVPAIFIVGLALTLFFSPDRAQSFYGSYDHQAGLVSYLLYFGWFILFSFNILSINNQARPGKEDNLEKRIRRVIITAALSGFVVSLYGILQIFNLDFLTWAEPPYLTHRAISTFGQPNFLASFLLLIIPLDFYLAFRSRRLWRRLAYIIISLSALLCLFFTASRGALVALVLVGLFFLIYGWRQIIFSPRRRIGLAAGIFAIIIIFFAGWHYFSPGRLTDFLNLPTSSVSARLNFYSAAVTAIKAKPFFGYGLENAGEVFIHYYAPDWGLYANVGASTDRAHNLVLDILLSAGIWGLFLFAGLYYYFFRLMIRAAWPEKNRALAIALGLGAAGYLLSLFFSFSLVAGEIYFWLWLSLLAALNFTVYFPAVSSPTELAAPGQAGPLKINALKFFLAVLAAVFIGWQICFNIQALVGDYYFFKVSQTLDSHRFFTALILKEDSAKTAPNPVSRDYYNIFWGAKLSALLPSFLEKSAQAIARRELLSLDKSLPDHGLASLFVKGKVAVALGNYQSALYYFKQVEVLAPFWPVVYLEEGKMFLAQGEPAEAIKAYQNALRDLPNIKGVTLTDAHARAYQFYFYSINRGLGDAYSNLNNQALAADYYASAQRSQNFDYLK